MKEQDKQLVKQYSTTTYNSCDCAERRYITMLMAASDLPTAAWKAISVRLEIVGSRFASLDIENYISACRINYGWWQHFRMMWLSIAYDYRENYVWQ